MAFTLLQEWEGMSGSGQLSVVLVDPSFIYWTPRRVTRKSNFTVSTLPDCIRLESLEEVERNIQDRCFGVMRSS